MTRVAIPLVAALLLAGCISKNPYQPVYYYTIDQYIAEDVQPAENKFDFSLAVMDTRASSRHGVKMLYRLPNGVIGFREYDRWVENPSELVTQEIIRAFAASGAFRCVGCTSSLRWARYSLVGYITRFDEVREDGVRTAEFSIRFDLNRVEGGDAVWSEVLSSRQEMAGGDAAAFAEALGHAVESVLTDVVKKVTDAIGRDLKAIEEERKKKEAEKTREQGEVTEQ